MNKNAESVIELEILVATMNRNSLDFLHNMFEHNDLASHHVLIVNQTVEETLLSSNLEHVRVINSFTKGLSKSRNIALANAKGSICLIADDDTVFVENFQETILNAYQKHPKVSLITFQIQTFSGVPYKTYATVEKPLQTKKEIKNLSSVELTFKRETIQKHKIQFNELFGLNSHFEMGEEFVFANDVLQHELQIYYMPFPIVLHSEERSTSILGEDRVVYARAALAYCTNTRYHRFEVFKLILFLLRKRFINITEVSKKLTIAKKGIHDYKKYSSTTTNA